MIHIIVYKNQVEYVEWIIMNNIKMEKNLKIVNYV